MDNEKKDSIDALQDDMKEDERLVYWYSRIMKGLKGDSPDNTFARGGEKA